MIFRSTTMEKNNNLNLLRYFLEKYVNEAIERNDNGNTEMYTELKIVLDNIIERKSLKYDPSVKMNEKILNSWMSFEVSFSALGSLIIKINDVSYLAGKPSPLILSIAKYRGKEVDQIMDIFEIYRNKMN